ncbi:TetR/AcrR family transcriptional regulator [Chloroflexi bacterium TSY]|nr:TetR/AcrR family transcriptional regulator [Chloroflexi bacterium TSY]
MVRKTKQDWLEEGVKILAKQGAPALKIDRLTTQMKVTKGSFYHHFKNVQEYKIALLEWIERQGTLRIIELTEQAGSPIEKFNHLLHITTDEPLGLEVAIRAWALQDTVARDYQQRIDEQRLVYVERLFLEMGSESAQAHQIAQMIYAMYIGCTHMLPPIEGTPMIQLFEEFRRAFQLSELPTIQKE